MPLSSTSSQLNQPSPNPPTTNQHCRKVALTSIRPQGRDLTWAVADRSSYRTADEGVVGTEHLWPFSHLIPGSRVRRILNDLHVDIAAIKRERRSGWECASPPPSVQLERLLHEVRATTNSSSRLTAAFSAS